MKAVGKHFAKVADKAYARHGSAWAGLLTNWPEIVGPSLSDICCLEKVKWPTHASANQTSETSRSRHQKIGGTLILKVVYGRALEIQHSTPQIIDRINAYYGYSAIAQIKIIQGKVEKKLKKQKKTILPLDPVTTDQLNNQMSDIEDDNLKHALHKLAKGVLRKD